MVELPTLKLQRKVKSMQIFRQPVTIARQVRASRRPRFVPRLHIRHTVPLTAAVSVLRPQGDRVGVCLTQLEAELFERGLVAASGVVQIVHGAIGRVRKVRFYKSECPSKSKFHGACAACAQIGRMRAGVRAGDTGGVKRVGAPGADGRGGGVAYTGRVGRTVC